MSERRSTPQDDRLLTLLEEAESRFYGGGQAQVDIQSPIFADSTEIRRSPLTSAQERLWYLERIDPEPGTFIRPIAVRLSGQVDCSILEQSLSILADRHEVLRSSYGSQAGRPVMEIVPHVDVALKAVAVEKIDADFLFALLTDPALQIDPETPPMWKVRLYRPSIGDDILFFGFHHTIMDAWSAEVLRSDLAVIYNDLSRGGSGFLPPLQRQPSDVAVEQRRLMGEGEFEEALEQIADRVRQSDGVLELPTDFVRPSVRSHRGKAAAGRVDPTLMQGLMGIVRDTGATLFMVLVSAYAILLWRWTGKTEFVIGSPTASRGGPSTPSMLGFFINRILIAVTLSPQRSFKDLLQDVRRQTLDALSNSEAPFELVLERLAPGGGTHRPPLIQTTFNLEAIPRISSPDGPVQFDLVDVPRHVSPFDLSVEARPERDGIDIFFIYNRELFREDSIGQMVDQYIELLRAIADDHGASVERLPLISNELREQILSDWSDGGVLDFEQVSMVDRFESLVDDHPDAEALVFKDDRLTYSELDRMASRLAHHLRATGVGEHEPVAVVLPRSVEMVASFLAILKAGAHYVPIDLIHPGRRKNELIQQTSCEVVVTTREIASELDPSNRKLVLLDEEEAAIGKKPSHRLGIQVDPADLAYIVHTSGSTGMPKGVPCSQAAVLGFLHGAHAAGLGPTERHLWISSPGFDMTNYQLWGALLFGGCCVMSWEEQPTPLEIARIIQSEQVTTARMTASFLNLLIEEVPESLKSLRSLSSGGERLSVEHARRARQRLRGCRIFNWYGPTETISSATEYELTKEPPEFAASIPVGRPQPGRVIYILDHLLEPVPPGIVGDLYIGGGIMSEGYLNDPEATARSFVRDPLKGDDTAVMYRTGDRGRWLPDGYIEFLGRADRQLQVRGFRVEPGEVESAIARIPGVRDVAVVPVEVGRGGLGLAAFVDADPESDLDETACRKTLAERITHHLVPSVWSFVDRLPANSAGKTDYRLLTEEAARIRPKPLPTRPIETDTQRRLAAIWEDVLGTSNPGLDDDFFRSGGHSLLAAKMYVRIEREFDTRIPIATLFSAPTIAGLARLLDEQLESERWPTLLPIRPDGRRPAFFLVAQGNVVGFEKVASRIDDRAFYLFHHPAVHRDPLLEISIEDMAETLLRELRKTQRSGPYLLGGWCAGSVVAFEMARKLRSEGDEVALLAIMDSIRPPGVVDSDGRVVDPLLDERSGSRRLNPPILPLRLVRRYVRKSRLLLMSEHRRKSRRIKMAMVRARSRYRPTAYDGPLTLFQANPRTGRVASLQALWPRVTSGPFSLIRLDCAHHELWNDQNAEQTAAAISREIDRALGERQ